MREKWTHILIWPRLFVGPGWVCDCTSFYTIHAGLRAYVHDAGFFVFVFFPKLTFEMLRERPRYGGILA